MSQNSGNGRMSLKSSWGGWVLFNLKKEDMVKNKSILQPQEIARHNRFLTLSCNLQFCKGVKTKTGVINKKEQNDLQQSLFQNSKEAPDMFKNDILIW